MIVKGSARKDGHALAVYFMQSEDGARRIFGSDPMGDTITAMTEWDEIGRATRGEKPLYHLQLCPDAKYPVTDEQYKRMAEIVMEEVGAKGYDYELYYHPGVKDNGEPNKPHAHLGICRTNRDTMKMLDLSYNYVAHERASKRIALEFGWELVPGKHAKRDRKKQPEFPRQKLSKAEAQYEKRMGLSKEERVKQISALHAASDSGPAFKAALEDAGYVLAKGKRGYVVVDQAGGQSVLTRNVGLKKKDLAAYMAGVGLDKLPTVEEAKALQVERRKARTVSKSDGQAASEQQPEKKAVEASKFLKPETTAKAPEPTPAPRDAEIEAAKMGRRERKPEPVDPERKQQIVALRAWADGAQAFKKALEEAGYTLARGNTGYVLFSEDGVFSLARYAGLSKAKLDAFMSPIPIESLPAVDDLIEARKQGRPQSKFLGPQPEARPPAPLPTNDLAARMEISALDMAQEVIAEAQRMREKSDLDALQQAIAKRQEEEAVALRTRHEAELRAREVELDRTIALDLKNFTHIQEEQTEAFLQARKEERTGIKAIARAIENRWNPTLAADRAKHRDRELRNFYRRLAKERADYEALILQSKQMEIESLKERQALQRGDAEHRHQEERERYIREYHEAQRIREEVEAQRRQQEELERDENLKGGPPPPKLGK